MSRRQLHRILVLVTGSLGENIAGPAIRAAELAKALSSEYEVTLAPQDTPDGEYDGMRVISSSRTRLVRESARHDALLAACLPPYLLALKPLHGFYAVADLHDPHEMEIATKAPGRERERELRAREAIQAIHLRHADMVLCASESQREKLLRTARTVLGRNALLPDPIVLPFGLSDPPPPQTRRPLREHFPQLSDNDMLVYWWGAVWRWLDAETAVRAFARIQASRSDVKLVINAGRPPSEGSARFYDAADEVRELADRLGVLGRSVLFYDEWVPYPERHDYLRDADLGLTLHRYSDEARLAARARYMDYLWAELPCVLGRGDEIGEELGAAGFATLLEDPDPDELAATLLALADDRERLAAASAAGRHLAEKHRWSVIGAKLREALAVAPEEVQQTSNLPLLRSTGAYYVRQSVDRLVTLG